MTATPEPPERPRDDSPGPADARQDNGLRAAAYVPLTDVEPAVGQHLLTALGRARIAAYLSADELDDAGDDRRRLFVASEERGDARTIVAAAVRALGAEADAAATPDRADPLAGIDTDSVFDALVADWHVDTHHAIRDAERDLSREDAEWRSRLVKPPAQDPVWLDDDHYVPPPPPPLPRLAAPTAIAVVVLVVSIFLLGFGAQVGLGGDFSFVAGIVGVLLAGGILLTRVRTNFLDEDDDGSAV